jgi:Tfp pilus assembly protein PilF/ribonuclease BN (tRNA processing enzyme)
MTAKKRAEHIEEDVDAEFSRLFWAARREQSKRRKKAAVDDPEHKAAVGFAAAQGWPWAELLLEASRLDRVGEYAKVLEDLAKREASIPERWQGLFHFVRGSALHANGEHDEAIKAYRKSLNNPNNDTPGNAWNNLGIVLAHKGKHDEAIKAYRKSLDDPKNDSPGNAWNNLGIALASKGKQNEAIKAYQKALEDPKFDSPGSAWYNLGLEFESKGEHDEAIKAYRKSLEDPKFDTPGHAWNNLGNALAANGEQDEAIKAYRKALEDPKNDAPGTVWTNLAKAYIDANRPKQAEEALKKALASPDSKGGDHARARSIQQLLSSKITPDALSPDDRAMVVMPSGSKSTDEIESGIIAAIQEAGDTQYEKYTAKPDSQRDNTFSILRGWSSAVTLLEGSERRWRGGGYFIKWRGHGIVIDPGFDFLRNFHDAGYHGREISAVIVSHNHPDHNSDVKDIDDLRYELYKRRDLKNKSSGAPYVLIWDQDTDGATKFGFINPEHRHEAVVLPAGFPQAINLMEHPAKLPLRVIPFKVNHGSDVPHAMGMVVELLDKKGKTALRIGYTADTSYYEDLHKHLTGCDVLIAHISQPSIQELKDASKFKEVHLGYRGTARLLKECNPKLVLIGEFWAGFTDLRIALVKGLRQRSGVKHILPAGLAMHLRLPSLDIECTECKKPMAFSGIKVAPPTDNFGSLAYLCPGCMIG